MKFNTVKKNHINISNSKTRLHLQDSDDHDDLKLI